MSELLRETIGAAERAVAGQRETDVHRHLERLESDPGVLRAANGGDRAYLALLLDSLGLHDKSAGILHGDSGPAQVGADATLRNTEAMLAAAHGQYARAHALLTQAKSAAANSPALRATIFANLAAVSIQAGSINEAEAWAEAADASPGAGSAATDVLIATVRAVIASARADTPGLRAASESLGTASRARIGELGAQHPQALALVANMARTEIMVARAEGSPARLERAAGVLEIAAFRLAAELGSGHPLSLAAKASLENTESGLMAASAHAEKAKRASTVKERVRETSATDADVHLGSAERPQSGAQWGGFGRRMPLPSVAATSGRSSERAGPRFGGGGDPAVFGAGSIALETRSAPHGTAGSGIGGWIRAYLRRAAMADFVVAAASSALAVLLNYGRHFTPAYAALIVAFPLLWIGTLWLFGAYDDRYIGTGVDEYRKVVNGGVSLTAVLLIVSYAVSTELSRMYLLLTTPGVTVLTLIVRYTLRKWLHRQRDLGRCMTRVLAVGPERAVEDLITALRRDSYHGLAVVGACITDASGSGTVAGVPVFGGLDDVAGAVRRIAADTVAVLSSSEIDGSTLRQLAWELEKTGTDLCVAPALLDVAGPRTTIRPVAGLTLLHVDHPQLSGPQQVLKQAFDRVAAGILLVLLAPLVLSLAVAIRLGDKGPALFAQTRVGKDGKPFKLYKFRTMVVGAERRSLELRAIESDGVLFKMRRDPRITRMGAWLRRYSLDELPELINVLRGEMSLVGPRPPLPDEVERYTGHVRRRLAVKPGLTGLWQVNGRSDLSWDEAVRLDLRYVENWSFPLDLQILWKTISVVFKGSGAY